MAIFYQYIKGYAPTGTGVFDFLSFGPTGVQLKVTSENNFSATGVEHGYLLTTAGPKQTINKEISFQAKVEVGPSGPGLSMYGSTPITFGSSNINIAQSNNQLVINGPSGITLEGATAIHGGLDITGNMNVTGSIYSTNLVQGLYFNAASDRRCKENIQPLTESALDYIKKMNVYSFDYISQPEARTLGVIAQELQEIGLYNNVDFVVNNNDMLAVKESKLVYLLLKAVQEQQDQIKLLQEQLEELKHE